MTALIRSIVRSVRLSGDPGLDEFLLKGLAQASGIETPTRQELVKLDRFSQEERIQPRVETPSLHIRRARHHQDEGSGARIWHTKLRNFAVDLELSSDC